MNDRLIVLVGVPLLVISLVSLFSVLGALFSDLIRGTQSVAQRMHGRSFLLGLANVLFASILIAALSAISRDGLLQLLALLLLTALVVAVAFGLAGIAPLLGSALLPDASPTRQTVWGSIAMLLASLTPVIGWFVLFPYLAMRGLGALVIHLFTR